ncbi:hypothetical protein C0995_003426 [Termitomyces sp. Mi166|nr:hypothetical protein C0995_003426 [Termitomyces sp. Mi166\
MDPPPTPRQWKLLCVLVDEKGELLFRTTPFLVEVWSNTEISTLKQKIQSQNPRTIPYDSISLDLWKPTKDIRVTRDQLQEIITGLSLDATNDNVKRLDEVADVSEYWKTAPNKRFLQLIVQVPQKKRRREGRNDTPMVVKRLRTVSDIAPSSLAQPAKFKKVVGEGQVITVNRPYETSIIPIALFDRTFGTFRDRCKQPPSNKAMDCLLELSVAGCEWYQVEALRREAITRIFSECLGLQFHAEKIGNTEYITDDHLIVIIPAAVRECNNEEGFAMNQATLYYVNFLSRALKDRRLFCNRNTCFPSVLVVNSGSTLGFYGAIWDGQRVRVEPLCRGIDLIANWKELHARYEVAATLDALVEAVRLIKEHYALLKATITSAEPCDLEEIPRYPYLTSYRLDNAREVSLVYTEQLEGKLVFAATPNQLDLGDCIVKFTQHEYSADAHSFLAMHGMAPKLREIIEILGGGKRSSWIGQNTKSSIVEKVKDKVKSIVHKLHQNGFVHGDIRAVNLLIDPASLETDDVQLHLIDFDWADLAGEVHYPIGLNCKTVQRPQGVEGGKLIMVAHDIEMISYLFV